MNECVDLVLEASRLRDENAELRAKIGRLNAKIRNLVRQLDDQLGTPCEQIRHEQEIERLRTALEEIAGDPTGVSIVQAEIARRALLARRSFSEGGEEK